MKAVRREALQLRADAEVCLELLAPARDVLFVGELQPDILDALDAAGYNVSCVAMGSEDFAAAEWPIVAKLSDDALAFPEAITSARFDGVLLYGLLDGVADPTAFLAKLRRSMGKNEPLVGVLHRNDAEALFQRAGFLIDRIVKPKRAQQSGFFKVVVRAVPRGNAGVESTLRVEHEPQPTDILTERIAVLESQIHDLNAELTARSSTLQQLREEYSEHVAESRYYSAALESSRNSLRDAQTQLWGARRTIDQLELQIAQGSQYVTELLEQLSQKEEQIADGGVYARELEAKLSETETLMAELEAVRSAAISDKMVMREYVDTLRAQVAEIPLLREAHQELLTQTEELIAEVQKESAQIVTLIDTVQSSHFWKVKRFLNRVRARILRR